MVLPAPVKAFAHFRENKPIKTTVHQSAHILIQHINKLVLESQLLGTKLGCFAHGTVTSTTLKLPQMASLQTYPWFTETGVL